ncbi:MAG: hypothetical protein CML39_08980 [Rhodobacteraceae bacterium]|nr:MAG: hypothetical protein CML39_08980 [Paracoccaceae bacterium]
MNEFKPIFLVASLMAMGALSIDTMLPALSMVKTSYNILSHHGHWIITSVFLGISTGQLLFGPISDSIGRKKTALIGLLIFGFSNLISIFATDYTFFLMCRFFQGLGAGATVVVSRAIARDIYSGTKLARLMSLVSSIFILVPVLAPSMGQLIITLSSWQFIPITIMLFCFSLTLWISIFQIETNKLNRPLNFEGILDGIIEVVNSKISRSYTITAGLTFGILVSFLNISQPLFQEYLFTGKYFSLYFGAGALAVGLGSILNAKLLTKFEPVKIVNISLKFELIWAVIFLIFFSTGGITNIFSVMLFLLPNFFIFGAIFGNMNAIAMSPMGHIAGTASAIIGTSTTLTALPIAASIAYFFSGSLVPFTLLIILVASLSLLITKK